MTIAPHRAGPAAVGADSVPAVLRAHAADDDGREFLRLRFAEADDEVVSYAQLIGNAARWAAFYAAAGIGPGERVVVVLPHSLDLYAAYAGALLGGQVPAMFAFPSPKFSEERYFANVGELLAGAGGRMLVTYPDLAGKLAARERAALGGARVAVAKEAGTGTAALPPAREVDPAGTAFLQYSSGTTGLKKGVAVSHRALLWQVRTYGEAIGAGPGDRIVSWLPLYHDMGLVACYFLPLLLRVPLVAMSPFDWVRRPSMWIAAASSQRATLAWLPNFAYSFLAANARDADIAGADLSSLRGVVNCSEPVLAASHDAFLRRFTPHGARRDQLAASYAMAENTFAVTSAGFGAEPRVDWIDARRFDAERRALPVAAGAPGARALVSSGAPLPQTDVTIVGDGGEPLPERTVGEIVLRSPSLMREYDANPEATGRALRDGRYHSGDLGYLAGGELFVTGRKADLIIVGGRNIYPQDIETLVERVDGVIAGRVVAFGAPDERLGTERLVVLAESDHPERAEELRAAIFAAIAQETEVVPGDIRIVAQRSLLKSTAGKLARGANRERYLAALADDPQPDATPPPPGDDVVEAVRACVGLVARAATPGDRDALVTSGRIDSFSLVELLRALEERLGVVIEPELLADIERFDTIAAIAATVTELRAGGPRASAGAEALDPGAIPMTSERPRGRRAGRNWWSLVAQARLRALGVRTGGGLRALGPIVLELGGGGHNLVLGRDVTLMPGVHFKNRERGRIVVHDGVKLDTNVRLVAANDALVELGDDVALGMGTVINAGADVRLGRGSLSSLSVMINASEHGMAAGTPIREQAFTHAAIAIGEDAFLGAGAYIGPGARVGHGAVVSAGAAVAGSAPAGAIVQGRPARVVKFRA